MRFSSKQHRDEKIAKRHVQRKRNDTQLLTKITGNMTLDRTLTLNEHLDKTGKKERFRVNLIQ